MIELLGWINWNMVGAALALAMIPMIAIAGTWCSYIDRTSSARLMAQRTAERLRRVMTREEILDYYAARRAEEAAQASA